MRNLRSPAIEAALQRVMRARAQSSMRPSRHAATRVSLDPTATGQGVIGEMEGHLDTPHSSRREASLDEDEADVYADLPPLEPLFNHTEVNPAPQPLTFPAEEAGARAQSARRYLAALERARNVLGPFARSEQGTVPFTPRSVSQQLAGAAAESGARSGTASSGEAPDCHRPDASQTSTTNATYTDQMAQYELRHGLVDRNGDKIPVEARRASVRLSRRCRCSENACYDYEMVGR